MKKRGFSQIIAITTALATCTTLSFAATPPKFYPNGFYMGLGAAAARMQPSTLNCTDGACTLNAAASSVDLSAKTTPGGVVHIGYALKRLPLQFELSYQYFSQFTYSQSHQAFTTNIPSTGVGSISSKVTTQAAFANVIVNGSGLDWPVIPFALFGYGADLSRIRTHYNASNYSYPYSESVSGSSSSYGTRGAWQAGAGIYYRINANLLLSLTYKYQDLGSLIWKAGGSEMRSDRLTNNQGEIGLVYFFGDQHHPPSLINEPK